MNARALVLALSLGSLVSAPALAVGSLTGTWQGTLKCSQFAIGGVVKSKVDATVTILDGKGIQLNMPDTFGLFVGTTVIDETGKPANGAIAGISCGHANDKAAIVRGLVKAKPEDPKGTLDLEILSLDTTLSFHTTKSCTLKAKRVDTVAPGILLCAE
jgi:hypothetical protein